MNKEEPIKEDLKKKADEYLEGWKRERAAFLNHKKEEMERISALMKYADEELIMKMLPILDNWALAEKNIPEELKKDKNVEGILQIHQQFRNFLKAQGVEEIKAVGEKFDPNFHEVVREVEGKESGIIVEETQKGYTLNKKVIRASKVVINK